METCALCGSLLKEAENIKTRFEEKEAVTIVSEKLNSSSPVYKIYKHLVCIKCGVMAELKIDSESFLEFELYPQMLIIPERRLKPVVKIAGRCILTA